MFFQQVKEAPPDPIFGLLGAFNADVRKEKVNLMVGIYKDDRLKAEVFSCVQMAKERVKENVADYLPIDGLQELVGLLEGVVFGEKRGRIYGAHTTGGTGALRVGAEFIAQEVSKSVYVSNHTWPNHRAILERAGCKVETYPYYSQEKRNFDLDGLVAFLKKVPEKSVILLHACCHNPTGCDPSGEEWREISRVMKERKLLPFFDCAYQGFGEGIEKDVESLRIFEREGHEMVVAYSCSKNFSMYCQRVGALFVVGENRAVGSQVKRIARALYSNPPAHGARLVAEVLKSAELRKVWERDLEGARSRLQRTRSELIQRLNFDYLRRHKGMFSFVDLSKNQVERLIRDYAIYMTDNGRISIAGLSSQNIDYVAKSILAVCEEP